MKPLIGISCCTKPFGAFSTPNHAASDTYVQVTDDVIRAVPVLIPANGDRADLSALLSRLDGIIFTGSRSNVHPGQYGGAPHAEGTPEDVRRDAVTLPLIRAAVACGVPILAICRGFQELNVALGGSLHQVLQDMPGYLDHSTPIVPQSSLRNGKAHMVTAVTDGWLHRLSDSASFAVNSLHNQGIDRLAPPLRADAHAPDGVIEAVRAVDCTGFVVGVQWHPEFDYLTDTLSHRIFEDFGAAVEARHRGITGEVVARPGRLASAAE
ncbi:gamma-glutamyl-gamma-aminobutyrate hydrolase family protein [Granulibacter bethesdensis]|uniref:gamma-glutamyl-gamma-aminobutyrate hydrolase family protein n=1 Tax=Granulibacter bethesdensis TaxID=364410 RepID=UPI00090CBF4E|nr:gamma-glutamyl-gamma-aminobutyrate hydrolase family protein [Granulibacter bethesdensis]APH60342.1 Glutamine amidotransferase, class I [Granulibacter bethesdensis]